MSEVQIGHLHAINNFYVELVNLLAEVPRLGEEDWEWTPEPVRHREYEVVAAGTRPAGRSRPEKIKPDAEIVLFGELVFFVERQTERSQASPDAIHKKVVNYHRYENSPERQSDPRTMKLLLACDAERHVRAALDAAHDHPTKTPQEARMQEWHTKRLPLSAGSLREIAQHVRDEARERLEDRR